MNPATREKIAKLALRLKYATRRYLETNCQHSYEEIMRIQAELRAIKATGIYILN